ncbi:cellulase family glycosylhydrolase [Nocardia acididurans]|uniref:cellulase family glycosylhydrolase n=1 Tax=Nocardia acididurans TaxID=2802282 RepID=UPI0027DDE1F4|nr:cellulase family glycosylhydrolase [Nocardia acididurans]
MAAALAVSTGCGEDTPYSVRTTTGAWAAAGAPAAPAAVTAAPTGLRLRGQPWWPTGFNGPQLATDYTINFGCGAEVDLDAFFRRLPDNTLTRFALFQAFVVDKESGELDFTAADAVFEAAEKYGRIILPVLTPQTGECGDEIFKQRQWYVDGWTKTRPVPGRSVMSFRDWMRTAVERWRSSPVLAGWELVGEPEPSNCGATCDLKSRTCPKDAAQVLRTFLDEAGEVVRALDPQRLLFAGFIGGTQCGFTGDKYRYVSESKNVDVLSYHDYSEENIALPGDPRSGLAARLAQARELGKPLLVGEIGEYAGSCLPLAERRENLDMRMSGQRAAGSAGALIWAYVPDPRLDECTYDVGPDDPLWELVAQRSTLG